MGRLISRYRRLTGLVGEWLRLYFLGLRREFGVWGWKELRVLGFSDTRILGEGMVCMSDFNWL